MTAHPLDRVHGGTPNGTLIDFSASLNPQGPPAEAIAAYHAAVAQIGPYPEPYAAQLTGAIAAYLGQPAESILAGSGSTQLLYLIARVLRPRHPVVVTPTFSEIANGLILAGAPVYSLALDEAADFALPESDLAAQLAAGADALFIGRPNSPTGCLIDRTLTDAILTRCAELRCWCVLDEAFIEFADDPWSAADLVKGYPRLIVTRSLTKLYAIAGLRLGYVVARPAVIADLAANLEPWSVSAPAATVGIACLGLSEAWRAQARAAIADERAYLAAHLGVLPGFKVFPSAANFLMIRVGQNSSANFGRYLEGQGLRIRDLSTMAGAGAGLYRIGVRMRDDNDRLLAAARRYCELYPDIAGRHLRGPRG